MGIPRFFKLLAERYPLALEIAGSKASMKYDNLYIDMNGIIHMRTHDNGKTEAGTTWLKMSQNICEYIETVFDVVKPTELLFLSVDGVVCRMKMNQQRSRRFFKTKEHPEGEGFDPNCISPGTEFMEYLQEKIVAFIDRKKREDLLWKKITVVFSGHRIPGEGEHKVVAYIRDTYHESKKKRHCIHGLDADLILLTLLTSMPQFSILREEMTQKNERTGRFHFFHSHIAREYLSLEMGIKQKDKGLNPVVDDLVLVMILFGNDFLPSAFSLLDSFDDILVLYGAYHRRVKKNLHRRGRIDWAVLSGFLEEVAAYEKTLGMCKALGLQPPEKFASYKNLEAKLLEKDKKGWISLANILLKKQSQTLFPTFITKDVLSDLRLSTKLTNTVVLNVLKLNGCPTERADSEVKRLLKQIEKIPLIEDMSPEAAHDLMWSVIREARYAQKDVSRDNTNNYLLGIHWICRYYFEECPSWTWYYPEHYSVFITDVSASLFQLLSKNPNKTDSELTNTLAHGRSYTKDGPLSPFTQLLGILPLPNKDLLPAPLQEVFTALPEYYPTTFAVDKDGKKAAWESLCLVPFVSIPRIQAEVDKRISRVSETDLARNRLDTLRVWAKNEEEMRSISLEFSPISEIHQVITAQSKHAALSYIPSLFAKRVFGKMSKIARPKFGGERKRMVVSVKPCVGLSAVIDNWNKNPRDKGPKWLYSGTHTYAGFPYLVPCRVRSIHHPKARFQVKKTGITEEAVEEAVHLQGLRGFEKVARDLFKDHGIFIQERESFAICEVNGEEVICALETLVCSHYINHSVSH
ncbi:5'-3' exoribonuclease 1 [Nematocida displodere]|uniref:5'-3' exoribonuclease 1 n=1 Tax=Nematocida displodere TaxID=1805483 RepID=A0A177ECI0_9MICR|nr:5'-3' exoribonuclease 1 [Nematocida displodere]